ncbi:MucR family transcriptional regulator [Methylobacterium nigriterrae]|uniref:MucR family transcriptional regulator n=1 Tax=Methylobacterium nigriterrae TaxID=3127512 RepID=UPI0030140FF3
MSATDPEPNAFVTRTAEIVSAYLSHNHVQPSDLPRLIQSVHAKLSALATGSSTEPAPMRKLTASEIKRSITPDYLVSFEDGKRYKTLRRHLMGRGLTAEEYRAKWGLPADYPMVASGYSAQRAELARSFGLGKLRRDDPSTEPHPAEQADTSEQMAAELPQADDFADTITREPFEGDDSVSW